MSRMRDVVRLSGREMTVSKLAGRSVTSPLSRAEKGGTIWVFGWVGVSLISCIGSGTHSETNWLDGNLPSCRKTARATRLVRSRFRETFCLLVYSSAEWWLQAADICEGNALFMRVCSSLPAEYICSWLNYMCIWSCGACWFSPRHI